MIYKTYKYIVKILTLSLLSTLVGIVCTGCFFSDCDKINLKKEDLNKLSHYDDVQRLIFKSDSNQIDTLIVLDNDVSYSTCNKLELSEFQFQRRRVSFKNSGWHGDTYSSIYFRIDNEYKENSSADFNLSVHNAWGKIDEFEKIDTVVNAHSQSIYIAKMFKWDGSAGAGKDEEINSFHWDDSIGLVRYTTHRGEIYDLLKIVK